ncbi:MAG: hypothetical protein FJW20_22585 [Acidimicrobiia bacterium]|nr:hypothetical protein [Acidimicrobiia bacterium]
MKQLLILLAASLLAQQPPDTQAKPRATRPESRPFDFWIVEWRDCVIFENWSSVRGMTGKSFNTFNPYKKKRQQSWVDDRGDVQDFRDGEYNNGVMRFFGDSFTREGKPFLRRLSFHKLGPDKVRQHSERSYDSGKTWITEYDCFYLRKE